MMRPSEIGNRIRRWTPLVLAGIWIASASQGFAANGKIAGQVLDNKSKEPLIQATVQVVGTTLGAVTDIDGRFQILAVPVGEHSVRASIMGYQPVVVTGILVKPDQTENVSFDLDESAVELEAVIVRAEIDLIQMDQATTKRDVSAEKIKTLPVTNVGDIIAMTPGVTVRNDRFHIRGGRSSEVLYNVDGVSMSDPLGGRGPTQALNLSGTEIENVSIIKGAWSPEYGGTSGIISVSTKDGGSDTKGHVQYFTDDFGTKNLNTYSRNFQRFEFNLGGPEPLFTKLVLPALGLGGPSDKLTYFTSLNFERSDTYTPINRFTTDATRADFREFKFLAWVLRDRQTNFGDALFKMSYRLSPDIRLTGQYKQTYERNMLWRWSYRYVPNNIPWEEDKSEFYSLRWTHNLSKTTYYEVQLSRQQRTFWQKPGNPNVAGGTLNPDDFLFDHQSDTYEDRNGNGAWDPPETWTDVYPDGEYTFGDVWIDRDGDGNYVPGIDTLIFDFNGNGVVDFNVGESFVDRNGNGRYDEGDALTRDGNGNGTYDPGNEEDLFDIEGSPNDIPEPYLDGDVSLGEPFTDVNRNGVYDDSLSGLPFGEPFVDLSHDSKYQGPNDDWVVGVPFRDLNGNGDFDRGSSTPSGAWSSDDASYDFGEPFNDLNGDGIRNAADGFYDRGWDGSVVWHYRRPRDTRMKVDLVSQMRREHEVKIGGEYAAYDLTFEELQQPYVDLTGKDLENSLGQPYPGRGTIRDFYNQTPKTGALYIVDKMEYGQMIAHVGFRYEYFIQANDASAAEEAAIGEDIPYADYRDRFAPRIAFAYPISDKAKVFFNYGHFYQLPPLFQMYARSTFTNSASGVIGNLNLEFVKTIKYEFGVQYMLSPEYLLSVQGFYSDDFGRVAASEIRGYGGLDARNFYENSEYSRARGIEFELEKKYGNYVSGSFTYDLSWAFGKSSAEALDYFANFYAGSNDRFVIQEFPLDWDERHSLTLILDIRVPANDHPKLFGRTIPSDWGLNIFWQYGSGFPYTPSTSHPGVEIVGQLEPDKNSRRYPAHNNIDVRFNKNFAIGPMHYAFEVWVYNVLDERNIREVYTGTGRPESGVNQSRVIYPSDGQTDPRLWEAGRQIRIGLGMDF